MPISLADGTVQVVLGVGDLRIVTFCDHQGFQYMTISQGDLPHELGSQLLDRPDLQWWLNHPAKFALSSVTKEGIDNFITVLKGMSDAWGKEPEGTPLSELLADQEAPHD